MVRGAYQEVVAWVVALGYASVAAYPEVEGFAFHVALTAVVVASHRAFPVEVLLAAYLAASHVAAEEIAASVESGGIEEPSSPAVACLVVGVSASRAVVEIEMAVASPAAIETAAASPAVADTAAYRAAEEIEMAVAYPAAVGTAVAYPAGVEMAVAAYPVVDIVVACRTCPGIVPGDPAYRKACRQVHWPYPDVAFRCLPAFEVHGHQVSLVYLPVCPAFYPDQIKPPPFSLAVSLPSTLLALLLQLRLHRKISKDRWVNYQRKSRNSQ